jgi:peroxiredoxin
MTEPTESPATQPQPSRLRRRIIGPFTGAQILGVIAAIVIAAVSLSVLTAPLTPPGQALPTPGSPMYVVGSPQPGFRIGDLAPELTGSTANGETVQLTDLDGNPVRLADLRGHPVWINFWATWCPPCQAETPILREMHDKYSDEGLRIVGISVQETTAEDVRNYVDKYSLDYIVGFDATSAIFNAYRSYVLPTQFFIDGDGVIRHVRLGGVTRDEADETIQELLNSQS